jgi:omega-hydroxy-beta-dihydromenaquinone-9 sulfotransferase
MKTERKWSWREAFMRTMGTTYLSGITFRDWMRLLRQTGYAIPPRFWPRAMAVTGSSFINSFWHRVEMWRFDAACRAVSIPPPLIILGHWRSGTTHLHNLVSQDDRFCYPNTYEVFYPHTFLSASAFTLWFFGLFVPKQRPFDQMAIALDLPQEDEFALLAGSLCSPFLTISFPRQVEHFDRFLTLRDVRPKELAAWRATFIHFLKKITYRYHKPAVLKSPTHTCRIRLLLELFPDAKFVHIRRNPFAVYQSTLHMLSKSIQYCQLQHADCLDWKERALRQYREMYDCYFDERGLIPPGRLHEMSLEELEADPMGQMRKMYEAISLPDHETMRPKLQEYVNSIADYKKNSFPTLADDVRARVATEWRRSFEEWGYAT